MGAMVAPVRSLEPAEGMKRIEARVRTSLRVSPENGWECDCCDRRPSQVHPRLGMQEVCRRVKCWVVSHSLAFLAHSMRLFGSLLGRPMRWRLPRRFS